MTRDFDKPKETEVFLSIEKRKVLESLKEGSETSYFRRPGESRIRNRYAFHAALAQLLEGGMERIIVPLMTNDDWESTNERDWSSLTGSVLGKISDAEGRKKLIKAIKRCGSYELWSEVHKVAIRKIGLLVEPIGIDENRTVVYPAARYAHVYEFGWAKAWSNYAWTIAVQEVQQYGDCLRALDSETYEMLKGLTGGVDYVEVRENRDDFRFISDDLCDRVLNWYKLIHGDARYSATRRIDLGLLDGVGNILAECKANWARVTWKWLVKHKTRNKGKRYSVDSEGTVSEIESGEGEGEGYDRDCFCWRRSVDYAQEDGDKIIKTVIIGEIRLPLNSAFIDDALEREQTTSGEMHYSTDREPFRSLEEDEILRMFSEEEREKIENYKCEMKVTSEVEYPENAEEEENDKWQWPCAKTIRRGYVNGLKIGCMLKARGTWSNLTVGERGYTSDVPVDVDARKFIVEGEDGGVSESTISVLRRKIAKRAASETEGLVETEGLTKILEIVAPEGAKELMTGRLLINTLIFYRSDKRVVGEDKRTGLPICKPYKFEIRTRSFNKILSVVWNEEDGWGDMRKNYLLNEVECELRWEGERFINSENLNEWVEVVPEPQTAIEAKWEWRSLPMRDK